MKRFLLQMAGESGTGKSTLARAIGRETGAVVLDKDYIKAPLMDNGLADEVAGGLSYAVFFSLAASLLAQNHSLILDSAAFYPDIRERGSRLAAEAAIPYRIIECICNDREVQAARLATRERLVCQPIAVHDAGPNFPNRATALLERHLVIDTTLPLEACLAQALRYIEDDQG